MKVILRNALSFVIYFAIAFAGSFGLKLLWDWIASPAGLSLSSSEVKEAASWAVVFATGYSLGELWRQRSKPGT
jgi:hypothetical protein